MLRLHVSNQFLPFLAILIQFLVPKIVESLQLIFPSSGQISFFLMMLLLHLVNPPCFQIFLKLLRHNPQLLCLDIIPSLLMLSHLCQSLIERSLNLIRRMTILKLVHFL